MFGFGEPCDAWTSYVVAFRWLLREIEVAALTIDDVSPHADSLVASLSVRVAKNDTTGVGSKRVPNANGSAHVEQEDGREQPV
eukprot:6403923-Amphidinium_carterae.1